MKYLSFITIGLFLLSCSTKPDSKNKEAKPEEFDSSININDQIESEEEYLSEDESYDEEDFSSEIGSCGEDPVVTFFYSDNETAIPKYTDREDWNLNGVVKTVSYNCYEDTKKSVRFDFDTMGNITKVDKEKQNGYKISFHSKKYAQGFFIKDYYDYIEEIDRHNYMYVQAKARGNYIYNNDGILIKYERPESYSEGLREKQSFYKYDSSGNLISVVEDGNNVTTIQWNGKVEGERIVYNRDGSVYETYNNKCIAGLEYQVSVDDKEINFDVDDDGRITYIEEFRLRLYMGSYIKTKLYELRFDYKNGYVDEVTFKNVVNLNNIYCRSLCYSFKSNGDLESLIEKEEDNNGIRTSSEHYEYEYDEHRNWIVRNIEKTNNKGEIHLISEQREISYYE